MKKLKLFLSLCMMCLCVAVLCIGILAASSATYNITGSMTYNMTADLAKINTRVYRVAGKSTESALKTAVSSLSTKTYAQIERDTTTTYIEHQRLSTLNAISETSTEQQFPSEAISMTFGEIEKEDECYYTYYIVISIVNKSTDGTLTATITDTIATDTTFYRYTNSTQTKIANDETKNIVIGISKIDDTDMTDQTFTYTLTVKYVVDIGDWPTALPLQADTTNNYWYVELGTYNSSPVKWRLVSVDGTSAYTTFDKANRPTYAALKGKAIFVNATSVGSTFFSQKTGSYVTQSSKIVSDYNTSTKNVRKYELGSLDKGNGLYAAENSYNVNYYQSNLRSLIMYGSIFGFTSVEQIPSYVYPRDLGTIKETKTSYTYSSDGLLDYFWTPSLQEVVALGLTGEKFWTRTPYYVYTDEVHCASSGTNTSVERVDYRFAILSAFQLA